jgi:choline dehydrogenase-like flavoprotein
MGVRSSDRGGAAGCMLAARLSEDAGVRGRLLEASLIDSRLFRTPMNCTDEVALPAAGGQR